MKKASKIFNDLPDGSGFVDGTVLDGTVLDGTMKKYAVKLIFKYSDVVHVEAENEKDAVSKAMSECSEEYDCFYDSEIKEESCQCRGTDWRKD